VRNRDGRDGEFLPVSRASSGVRMLPIPNPATEAIAPASIAASASIIAMSWYNSFDELRDRRTPKLRSEDRVQLFAPSPGRRRRSVAARPDAAWIRIEPRSDAPADPNDVRARPGDCLAPGAKRLLSVAHSR